MFTFCHDSMQRHFVANLLPVPIASQKLVEVSKYIKHVRRGWKKGILMVSVPTERGSMRISVVNLCKTGHDHVDCLRRKKVIIKKKIIQCLMLSFGL